MTRHSRRAFLSAAGLALTGIALDKTIRAEDSARLFAYVGRDPVFDGTMPYDFAMPVSNGGVDVFRVNMNDGSLQLASSTGPDAADLSCDGICASADGRFLYVIDITSAFEGVRGAGGAVAAFAVNRDDGSLKHLISRSSMGANPASVQIDRSNSRVIVGNHGSGSVVTRVIKKDGISVVETMADSATVVLYPVGRDGSLGSPLDVSVLPDSPSAADTGVRHNAICHSVAFDSTQRWIIATDNGTDRLYVYRFSPSARKLQGKAYSTPPGRAPRHLAVHPRAPFFFMTNERVPSVSAFHFDSQTGVPTLIQTIPTLADGDAPAPPGGGRRRAPLDIRLHPNGKFVYASTRLGEGRVSMAIYAVDSTTGRLTTVDILDAAGKGQREFNIDPSGKYLFGCNPISNDVVTYALDPNSGKMTQVAKTSGLTNPGVIDFASL